MITLTLEDSDSGTTVTKTFESEDTWMEIAKGFIYSLRGLTFEIPGDVDEYANLWENYKDESSSVCCCEADYDCDSPVEEDKQREFDFNGEN